MSGRDFNHGYSVDEAALCLLASLLGVGIEQMSDALASVSHEKLLEDVEQFRQRHAESPQSLMQAVLASIPLEEIQRELERRQGRDC